ncbi:MAG TPA: cobalamin-independent methionine synthase II family protein [Candidatus Limnocylindria bacterium]|nr:cobalamin-independent methionine synthase II family protein [Candidatus Limnocylindria bacterium]
MKSCPLRTSVIGSYPFPGWLELASNQLGQFGPDDLAELQHDAVVTAIHDQLSAGLDVITDGEQTRLDFNLSFYGHLTGLDLESAPPRRFGPPAHDQRGKHRVIGELSAPGGLGVAAEYLRLKQIYQESHGPSPAPVTLKASVPGPYTMSGRLLPSDRYPDRWALTEALLPIVAAELESLAELGCTEVSVDEPSMSCYAYKEDTRRFVDIFNRTVERVRGRLRVCTHLCFGNYKARAVGPRQIAPMFPAFLDFHCDEMHVEMASREMSELPLIRDIAQRFDVAVGIVDVKSYYIETVEDIVQRVKRCLEFAPADRLVFAPDCGLSQTARWAARKKLQNMVEGVRQVRKGI